VDLLVPAPEGQAPQFGIDSRTRVELGSTDADGRVHARCTAAKGARVEVWMPHGLRLLQRGEGLDTGSGPRFEKRISFETGSLAVSLDSSSVLPREGALRLDLAKPDDTPFHSHFIKHPLIEGRIAKSLGPWAFSTNTGFVVHGIEQGEWNLTIYASEKGSPVIKTKLPTGAQRLDTARAMELSAHVAIRV
jgi:hypothetical protein